MPFALLFIGIVLVIVAVRNQQSPFLALLGGDFSGPGNFFYWVIALAAVGAVGYIPKAKPVSDGLLVLILLALVLVAGKGGVFTNLTAALQSTNKPSAQSITQGGAVSQLAGGLGTAVGNFIGGQ